MSNYIKDKSFIVLLSSLFLIISCNAQNEFKSKYAQELEQFEQKLNSIYREKNLYGDFLFAIVDENGLAYSYALDRDIFANKKSSLNTDTPIYIASHTKSFTGTLLKVLEEKGELKLSTSLDNYLPQLKFRNEIDTKEISVVDLLNHTHGIFSTKMTWKTAFLGFRGTNKELIRDLQSDFIFDPSGKFRYSNVGPIIASVIAEEKTGQSWKSLIREHLFKPLKMTKTSANVTDFPIDSILPSMYVSSEKGIIENGFYKDNSTMHASGGIISTISDLSKWLSANIRQDENVLSKASWVTLHNSTTTQNRTYYTYNRIGYSLGWDIAEYGSNKILTRFGSYGGISFHISFMPHKKIGIIAFSNDNRAYLLPHLMANYAYNKLNLMKADSIFIEEKRHFDKNYEKENHISYPEIKDKLKVVPKNNYLLGSYKNENEWPEIKIEKKENSIVMHWGILKGDIYKTENENLISNLGVINRKFSVTNDTLKTGSLIYIKQ